MKFQVAKLFAVVALLAAAPVMAEDHKVSSDALSSLGLGKMNSVSEERGMDVRGHGTLAFVGGGSMAFGGISYHGEMSTVSFGGIDANSYKAFDKPYYAPAKASADPTTSTVVIGPVKVEEGYNNFQAFGAVKAGGFSSPWSNAPSAMAGQQSYGHHGWGH